MCVWISMIGGAMFDVESFSGWHLLCIEYSVQSNRRLA